MTRQEFMILWEQIKVEVMLMMAAFAPYRTGYLKNNAIELIEIENGFEISISDRVVNYVPYTNEQWTHPRWKGKKNPNEGWIEEGFSEIVMYIEQSLAGITVDSGYVYPNSEMRRI